MATYVLVPGFWLGAWAWDEVAAPLRGAGHAVLALTPAGLAERAGDGPDVTAEAHVAEVVEVLRARDLHDVVLVGHSGAGPTVTAVAERARERIAHLVFVDTGPLPDGMAQIDFNPPGAQAWIAEQIAANGGWYPLPAAPRLAELGASTAGLDDEMLDLLRSCATPEPGGVLTGGVRRGTPDPSLPKTVVACSFTAADAKGLIDAGVPAFAEMAGPEWSIRELPTGHWPMFSEPAALAGLLAGLAS
ncbi:alpha/beta fold hydrolase [Pseudonocardia bannensis]|uniref:Alpha/beta hydrolase n=1 Tax=Pseudonocardia bannensis TaxID=630973 RepID=A0A848DFD3_9PSEU|nr:alpha/beta fold hydrolase [Pseudonocardia bannensis]NMH91350.1 alpha/beta hydrolase [Pseudonocardia bannensis]